MVLWLCVVVLCLGVLMLIDCVMFEVGLVVGGTLVTFAGEGYGGSADAACAFDDVVVVLMLKGM